MLNNEYKCFICGEVMEYNCFSDERGICEYTYKCKCGCSVEFHYGYYVINYPNKIDVYKINFKLDLLSFIKEIIEEFNKIIDIGFPYEVECSVFDDFLMLIKTAIEQSYNIINYIDEIKLKKIQEIIDSNVEVNISEVYNENLFAKKVQLNQIFVELNDYIKTFN